MLQATNKNDFKSSSFIWVEDYFIESLSQYTINDESIRSLLDESWGVFFSAMFWKCVSDLSSAGSEEEEKSRSHRIVLSTKSIYTGNIDEIRTIMQGLVDIYDWYIYLVFHVALIKIHHYQPSFSLE